MIKKFKSKMIKKFKSKMIEIKKVGSKYPTFNTLFYYLLPYIYYLLYMEKRELLAEYIY